MINVYLYYGKHSYRRANAIPFTLFHLGPALAFGLLLKRYFHAPTFILASVILDVEPLLALLGWISSPLHGLLHSFLFASLTGLSIGCLMYLLEGPLSPIYRRLLLEDGEKKARSFVIAGVTGTLLHVLSDAPLYTDIQPFWPFQPNPLYYPGSAPLAYGAFGWAFIFSILYYTYLIATMAREKKK